ncbi:MAG: phosphoenolpyruvate carboxykinase (GTP), partial [Acidimicrobiia bacterium]|nr:phosphoenolpyruvate carboxykinase (GTP) [Acidimicrobiia bacterium]
WFRKGPDGKFLWPGFGENSRVLEWVFNRVNGKGGANKTAIGYVPSADDLDLDGLGLSAEAVAELRKVDPDEWRAEVPSIEEHFAFLGDHLPHELRDQLAALEKRLSD